MFETELQGGNYSHNKYNYYYPSLLFSRINILVPLIKDNSSGCCAW